MKINIVVSICWMLFLSFQIQGQCSSDLIQVAMAQSGKDAIFVREFKAKLQKGTVKNPIPSAKFSVYLKEKTLYRFNVANDPILGSYAILQLFDKGKCVGSTFKGNEIGKSFDFTSDKTGSFQVLISFEGGKPGCAAGIMSLIAQPLANSEIENDELETLYLNVENPVSIITDKELTDSIVFLTDNGSINEKSGSYFLKPESEGLTTLKVIIKDEKGNIKEEAKSDFLVRRLPTPSATIHGVQGGIITRYSLQLANAINIDYPIDFEKYGYKIIDFIVKAGEKRLLNSGKDFNLSLKSLFADISEETKLVIESIHVRTPEGQIITIEPVGFIVR